LYLSPKRTTTMSAALDQRARADRVEAGALVVLPELVALFAEDLHAAVVAARVVGHRAENAHFEARRYDLAADDVAPAGVHFAGEVDVPGCHRCVLRRECSAITERRALLVP
jgi:hypothetical protein